LSIVRRYMTFTAAADAKPKVPHTKHGIATGLKCRGCGAETAAEWRGPGGQYGSCCRRKADEARAALKVDDKDKLIAALTERVAAAESTIAEQAGQLKVVREEMDALRGQLSSLAQKAFIAPKRKALAPAAGNGALVVAKQPRLAQLAAGPQVSLQGWASRPSTSRPGESTWVNERFDIRLPHKPTISDGSGGFSVQLDLVVQLLEGYYEYNAEPPPRGLIKGLFEQSLGMAAGTVDGCSALALAFEDARRRAFREVQSR